MKSLGTLDWIMGIGFGILIGPFIAQRFSDYHYWIGMGMMFAAALVQIIIRSKRT